MTTVSIDHQALAHYFAQSVGGLPSVDQYWDKAKKSSVDIVSLPDRPGAGVTTYSTIGVSDHSIDLMSDGLSLRAELMLTLRTADAAAPNILATCAMDVINDRVRIRPGSILYKAVALYREGLAMEHILVVSPFVWLLEAQTFNDRKVGWLACVPISEAERLHAVEHGAEALEALLEEKGADAFNLERPSVL